MLSVLLILVVAALAASALETDRKDEPELRVSVGDFRVVAEAVPWKWGKAEYDPAYKTTELEGEPHYIRLPRYLPVHATIPTMARHPLTGDLVVVYSPYHDGSEEYPASGLCVSRDGGWTWTPQKLVRDLGFAGSCGRDWISLTFYTGYEPDRPNQARACVMRSEDGLNWHLEKPDPIISFPENMHPQPSWEGDEGGLVYGYAKSLRGIYKCPASVYPAKRVEEHDGSLYACGYGQFGKDAEWRNFLIKSDDQGHSWKFFADIGKFYEPDFCWLANGDMIAEARCHYWEPRPLLQTRSKDGGRTWSESINAPGVELITAEDRTWKDPEGRIYKVHGGANIDPVLLQMDKGLLVLAYGRPELKLRFSLDGTGNYWDYRTEIIPKYAVKDGKPWAFPVGATPTHQMCGMVKLSKRTVLIASNIYGYSPSGDPEKGRDVVFVVPVSMRRSGEGNSPPRISGPHKVGCKPGREVEVRFALSDPDGDWVRIVCPKNRDIEIHGNAINWRIPWDFKGSRNITVFAEDAWGARSKPFALTITST